MWRGVILHCAFRVSAEHSTKDYSLTFQAFLQRYVEMPHLDIYVRVWEEILSLTAFLSCPQVMLDW